MDRLPRLTLRVVHGPLNDADGATAVLNVREGVLVISDQQPAAEIAGQVMEACYAYLAARVRRRTLLPVYPVNQDE